jgi:hypothetical protein
VFGHNDPMLTCTSAITDLRVQAVVPFSAPSSECPATFPLRSITAEENSHGHSQFDDASRERAPWNAGKIVGTKRPFTQKQIWAIRFFLDRERRIRDRALFDLAIDSKLRGCDLVKIRIRDVVAGSEIRTRAIVIQQKTGRPVQFQITATSGRVCWPGSNGAAARLRTTLSRAGSITDTT